MAENVLETRIQLRYGTYSQWMNSNTILKVGEAAVCAFTQDQDRVIEGLSNSLPENTPPAIGIKIGDGKRYFYQLPWVQAVAADVFRWAKAANKPTYTAQEIQGLQSYVENLISGDVEVNIAPRIYQITQGTGDNQYKYYLRYKENDENSNWIVDTSAYIDLENLSKVVSWLGQNNLDNYVNLISRTAEQIRYFLGTLNYTDTPSNNTFITSVSQENGIISVQRAQPDFSNISGTLPVSQGGTGKTSLPEDAVLVGNGTDPVKTIPIAESIAANNYLVPNYLIKAYVDNATAGLTGAMHFVGESTVVITNYSNVDPRITGYVFGNAQPGDVILYDSKEFVWTGDSWRLLGDEGSYAVKGSIKDADIDPEADIQQSKISGLAASLEEKVDKEEGKTLTSNDFTDELLEKLDSIETGAQRNTIEHIMLNGVEIRPTTIDQVDNIINITVQEFDDGSQAKLAGIDTGAQVNKIEKIIYDGEELIPDDNKIVTINSDPHNDHINRIEQIFINGTEWVPNAEKQVKIIIDQAALNLNVLEGAVIPNGQLTEEVPQANKKLQLERIAATGDVKDLKQTADTYIILDCGSSTAVI